MAMTSLAVASLALAHPGHGTTDPASWAHYLGEPLHVALLGGLALAAVALLRFGWRKARNER